MIRTIIFALLFLIAAAFVIAIIINGIILLVLCIRNKDKSRTVSRIKKSLAFVGIVGAVSFVFVWFTQRTTYTPAILNEDGENEEKSISELQEVELNGRKEWISVRGKNRNNPVLLFLAGGPGGSQMAAVRHDLSEMEEYFVVVNWDQPGSGKSYGAISTNDITVDMYIEDGYALTKYLCETYNQEKIYVVGESWGSALGIFLIDKAPELYHAFIGTGQMVAFAETEIIDYELALKLARKNGDTAKIKNLEANGLPPYYGSDVTWKSAEYINYLTSFMTQNSAIENGGYNTFRDLFSEEYGIIDKINYFRGIVNTFNNVYQQLYEIDLRIEYTILDVPAYFFLGRHDINAPTSLVEEYFELLDAPEKEIIWFENSGHSPWINESSVFVQELLRVTKVSVSN